MKQKRMDAMGRVLQEAVDIGFVAGASVLVVQNGTERYYAQAGYADLQSGRPMERDAIFRLYSMSKPITATAAILLMDRGQLDLHQPVADFLPGFRNQRVCISDEGATEPVAAEATVHDLLSMTAGLAYPGDSSYTELQTAALFEEMCDKLGTDKELSTQEIANRLGQIPLCYQPGTGWQYSAAADVLGAVIEVASGMSFEDFLQQELFVPLGMQDTAFWVPPEKQHRLVTVYEQTEGGLLPYFGNHLAVSNSMKQPPQFASGGAGVCSTIEDGMKFTQMLLGHGVQILSPAARRYLTGCHLGGKSQEVMSRWSGLDGFSYGNLMRLLLEPGKAVTFGSPGEYGWDGWLGAYFANVPELDATLLLMYQRKDSGTTPFTRRMRNAFFAALSDQVNK